MASYEVFAPPFEVVAGPTTFAYMRTFGFLVGEHGFLTSDAGEVARVDPVVSPEAPPELVAVYDAGKWREHMEVFRRVARRASWSLPEERASLGVDKHSGGQLGNTVSFSPMAQEPLAAVTDPSVKVVAQRMLGEQAHGPSQEHEEHMRRFGKRMWWLLASASLVAVLYFVIYFALMLGWVKVWPYPIRCSSLSRGRYYKCSDYMSSSYRQHFPRGCGYGDNQYPGPAWERPEKWPGKCPIIYKGSGSGSGSGFSVVEPTYSRRGGIMCPTCCDSFCGSCVCKETKARSMTFYIAGGVSGILALVIYFIANMSLVRTVACVNLEKLAMAKVLMSVAVEDINQRGDDPFLWSVQVRTSQTRVSKHVRIRVAWILTLIPRSGAAMTNPLAMQPAEMQAQMRLMMGTIGMGGGGTMMGANPLAQASLHMASNPAYQAHPSVANAPPAASFAAPSAPLRPSAHSPFSGDAGFGGRELTSAELLAQLRAKEGAAAV